MKMYLEILNYNPWIDYQIRDVKLEWQLGNAGVLNAVKA